MILHLKLFVFLNIYDLLEALNLFTEEIKNRLFKEFFSFIMLLL